MSKPKFDILQYLASITSKINEIKCFQDNHEEVKIVEREGTIMIISDLVNDITITVQHIIHTAEYMTERMHCQIEYKCKDGKDKDANPKDGKSRILIDQQPRGDSLDKAFMELYSAAYQNVINTRFLEEFGGEIKIKPETKMV